ncbi:hypothetical protein RED65_15117 [Oceanobacter sp. RED65]|uniref:Uncharacterized protein n=1 Tax=Bermanella marisrubri TaxID=207949 RepID=Q1N427_9GAMM|nr:hypothetical protein RED65_15117 [Oceanobacter sp. RED65] [Bermanella marisrubri]
MDIHKGGKDTEVEKYIKWRLSYPLEYVYIEGNN